MQIRYLKTGEVFHVDVNTGRERIAAGLAVEVPAAHVPPKPLQTSWQASEGRYAGIDYQYPPYIYVNCGNCSQRQWVENVSPAFAFRHCGVTEKIPNTVLAPYEALVLAYKARSKKPFKEPSLTLMEKPNAEGLTPTDRQLLAARGMKTRAELLQEHLLRNEYGRKKG
jgi:hypothetical protein